MRPRDASELASDSTFYFIATKNVAQQVAWELIASVCRWHNHNSPSTESHPHYNTVLSSICHDRDSTVSNSYHFTNKYNMLLIRNVHLCHTDSDAEKTRQLWDVLCSDGVVLRIVPSNPLDETPQVSVELQPKMLDVQGKGLLIPR